MLDIVATIDIGINPEIVGGLTWHGLFTAVGIALGVWLSARLAKRVGILEDDAMSIAIAGVVSGIIGARLLWVLEHTDQIDTFGDIFNLPDGGISIYGAMIGGVLGGFIFVVLRKPNFPRWIALDVAAPGMILGQAVGRVGDFINGEHFADPSGLPWAFRYTHPNSEGPWAQVVNGDAGPIDSWTRGENAPAGFEAVAVHPVAGVYEPLLDLAILGGLLLLRRTGLLPGWGFIFYVLTYALVRGTLAILRTDEQNIFGGLSVPQLLAVITAAAAGVMAYYLLKNKQEPPQDREVVREERRTEARERRTTESTQPTKPTPRVTRRVPGGPARGGKSRRKR
jgi:phosphatidylglycerol:prolipoprotein diacylglycerol transferase